MTHETVAVLGAGGTMGAGMSRNLMCSGFKVHAWNRSREKAEPLADAGATVVSSPAEATESASIVLTILSDGDAVLETIEAARPTPGVVWLQMSTIGIDPTERCIDFAREAGLTLVDAPVLGTKKPAEDGTLTVLASGPEDVRDRVRPVFDAVGQHTLWVGEAGAGSRLKLAVNVWICALVEGAAEALALADALGLEPKLLLDAVEGGPLDSPYLQMKAGMMLERSFDPSFRLTLAAKDARLAADAARQAGVDLPLVETIAVRLEEGAGEHGDADIAATFLKSGPART